MSESNHEARVSALAKQLRSGDAALRCSAVRSLAWESDKDSIPLLLNAFRDSDPHVRGMAVIAIGEIGLGCISSDPAFIALLQDPRPDVRASATECIGSLQTDTQSLIHSVIQLFDDTDRDVRYAARGVLRRTIPQILSTAVGVQGLESHDLIQRCISGTTHDRVGAALALTEGGETGIAMLAQLLREPEPVLRRAAILALGKIGRPALAVIAECSNDFDAEVRESVIQSLAEVGDNLVIPLLAPLLRDRDAGVRAEAAFALGKLEDKHGIASQALLSALSDIDPRVRCGAAIALGAPRPKKPEILVALTSALNDTDLSVRHETISTLVRLAPFSENPMSYLIEDTQPLKEVIDSSIVVPFSKYLSGRDSLDAIQGLGHLLTQRNPTLRRFAAAALAECAPASVAVITQLAAALHDHDDTVRFWSAVALESLGSLSEVALPSLISALKDRKTDVRSVSARAIGKMGRTASIAESALLEAITDPDPLAAFFSAKALSTINPHSPFPVPILIDYASHAPDITHRRMAIDALGGLSNSTDDVLQTLDQATRDDDPGVRETARAALARLLSAGSDHDLGEH